MTPGISIAVAPVAGRIRLLPPKRFADGREVVSKGQAVAVVEGGAARGTVLAPIAGVVDGLLVHEGEPVVTGQPVLAVRS